MSSETLGLERERLSRPALFMAMAQLCGQRSSCPRAQVGVTAISGGRVVATGYVGAPAGADQCDEVGCVVVDNHCIRSVHAEANLISWAARTGTSLEGTIIYCTHKPCLWCAKLLINAGIVELNYQQDYGDDAGIELLLQQGITMSHRVY